MDILNLKLSAISHAGKAGMHAMKQMSSQLPNRQISNSQIRDSSSKIIFGEPVLCAQFLRGYVNIPIIKDVQPEDIEDVSDRYVHMFVEERNSDVVKKVRLKEDETPFYPSFIMMALLNGMRESS